MTVGCIERRKKKRKKRKNGRTRIEDGREKGERGRGLAAREGRTRLFLSLLTPICYGSLHDGGRE